MLDLPILVTGAAGFLGRATVNKLLKSGYIVYACGLEAYSNHSNYQSISLNLRNDQQGDELGTQQFQAVVHLASLVPSFSTSKTFDEQDLYMNGVYMPLLRLIKLVKNKTKHIVLASSVVVYGETSGCVTELHDCCPVDYYGMYKLFCEELCSQFSAEYQTKLAALRFTQLYGPGEPHGLFLQRVFLENAHRDQPIKLIRGGRDVKDLLWIEDAADAIVLAVRNETEGTFNISSGNAMKVKDIAEILRDLSGNSLKIFLDDDGSHAVSSYFSIEKAKSIMGFIPAVSLAKGLEQLYKKKGDE